MKHIKVLNVTYFSNYPVKQRAHAQNPAHAYSLQARASQMNPPEVCGQLCPDVGCSIVPMGDCCTSLLPHLRQCFWLHFINGLHLSSMLFRLQYSLLPTTCSSYPTMSSYHVLNFRTLQNMCPWAPRSINTEASLQLGSHHSKLSCPVRSLGVL